MTDAASAPPNAPVEQLQVTKLVTVFEEANQEVRTELIRQHFEGYDEEAMKSIVTNLLGTAAVRMMQEYERLEEENAELLTPINPGSLYDDVVFEAAIYASSDGQILVNASFGRLADPERALTESVGHVAEVLTFIARQFNDAELIDGP